MNHAQATLGVAAAIVVVAAALLLQHAPLSKTVTARFGFDEVAFAVPSFGDAFGAPLSTAERRTVEAAARAELAKAFAGFGITFSDEPGARYRVRVQQEFPSRRGWRKFAVAESVSMGAFGGEGSISFAAVASRALGNAPPDVTRGVMIDGIGRGIGRVAAHEFAHQLLHSVNLHASDDVRSYEFRGANRAALFYEPMHWSFAGPLLLERLGAGGGSRAGTESPRS